MYEITNETCKYITLFWLDILRQIYIYALVMLWITHKALGKVYNTVYDEQICLWFYSFRQKGIKKKNIQEKKKKKKNIGQ